VPATDGNLKTESPRELLEAHGASRPRMRDVAARAGVSIQTVSNFVNGRFDEMRPATKERVSVALAELGYQPNAAAASLRSHKVRTIAFLVLDEHAGFLADPLTDQLIAGIGDVARDSAYGVLLQSARPGALDGDFLRPLREGRAGGAAIQLSGPREIRRRYIDEARSLGLPIVVFDEIGLPDDVMSIRAHQHRGARQLTEYLLNAGHKRVAFIGAQVPWAVVEQRVAGYKAALNANGLRVDPSYVLLEAGYNAKGGEELAKRLMQRKVPPTAIICGSDLLAAGAMHGVKSLGLRIPADVAVAGFDDFEFSKYLDPPLTTVSVPSYQMGTMTARMIIQEIEGEGSSEDIAVFPTELVVRSST